MSADEYDLDLSTDLAALGNVLDVDTREVFTLSVDEDGSWLYDLDDQLDHDVTLRVRGSEILDINGDTNFDAVDQTLDLGLTPGGSSYITLKDSDGNVLSSFTYGAGVDEDGTTLDDLETALTDNGVSVDYTSDGKILFSASFIKIKEESWDKMRLNFPKV